MATKRTVFYPGPPLALLVKLVVVMLFLQIVLDGCILAELVYREVRHQMTETAIHEILNLSGN